MVESKIVEAVGTGTGKIHANAGEIEVAMAAAVQQALDEGVSMSDSDEIKRRMLNARKAVLDRG